MFTWGPQQLVVAAANAPGDPLWDYVVLLLHADGTDGGTSFPDSSIVGVPMSASGGAVTGTDLKRFGSAALRLDGDPNSKITGTSTPALVFAGDYTIEFWIFLNSTTTGTLVVLGNESPGRVAYYLSGGVLQSNVYGDNVYPNYGGAIASGQWMHIGIVRSFNTVRVYVNGSLAGSHTSATYYGITHGNNGSVKIGNELNGSIDELRITKGVARYTANFTPPSGPFPDVGAPGVDPFFANVLLLLHGEGADNSTVIADSSAAARAMTASGDARIRTTQKKFGVGSIAFDGTGDSVSTPYSPAFNFGIGDLTIEAWVFIAANSAPDSDGVRSAAVCNAWTLGSDVRGWALNILGNTSTTGTGLAFDTWSATPGNGTLFRASETIAHGVWHHVAATVSGGVRRLFLNGDLLAGVTTTIGAGSTQAETHGNPISVGRTPTTPYPLNLNGNIDELRITTGIARYTSNFTPPSEPFPDVGP